MQNFKIREKEKRVFIEHQRTLMVVVCTFF